MSIRLKYLTVTHRSPAGEQLACATKFRNQYVYKMVAIAFKTLSEQDFNALSNSFSPIISGHGQGDINIFRRYRNNKLARGRGLWSILSQVGRKALPFLKEWVLPSAKEYGKNVLSDVMAGRALKSSLKSRGKESLKNIGSRIMSGKGSKRRRNRLSTLIGRKRASLRRRQRCTVRKGKGKCTKKTKRKRKINRFQKNKKKTYGLGKRKKISRRRRKSKYPPGKKGQKNKRIARSRRTVVGTRTSCSRKKTSLCPKDIFS